jgi:hypothetical protein
VIISRIRRTIFGLRLVEKKQCYREMRTFVDASIAVADEMAARQRAIFRAAEKWGISWRVADGVLDEGTQKDWT